MADRKSGRNADGTFSVGNSGKPKGTRHKATQAALALLEGEAEALSRKAIETALEGDTTALRLCLERIAPPRKDAPVTFDLPPMQSATDAAKAAASVLEAVASGYPPRGWCRLFYAFGKAGIEVEVVINTHQRLGHTGLVGHPAIEPHTRVRHFGCRAECH